MKLRILCTALLLAVVSLQAQTFTVLHCTSGCKHLGNGKGILTGETVSATEQISLFCEGLLLRLYCARAAARCLVPQKYSPSRDAQEAADAFMAVDADAYSLTLSCSLS